MSMKATRSAKPMVRAEGVAGKVKELGAANQALALKYTGPWPPDNFVNIRLKLERAKEAE